MGLISSTGTPRWMIAAGVFSLLASAQFGAVPAATSADSEEIAGRGGSGVVADDPPLAAPLIESSFEVPTDVRARYGLGEVDSLVPVDTAVASIDRRFTKSDAAQVQHRLDLGNTAMLAAPTVRAVFGPSITGTWWEMSDAALHVGSTDPGLTVEDVSRVAGLAPEHVRVQVQPRSSLELTAIREEVAARPNGDGFVVTGYGVDEKHNRIVVEVDGDPGHAATAFGRFRGGVAVLAAPAPPAKPMVDDYARWWWQDGPARKYEPGMVIWNQLVTSGKCTGAFWVSDAQNQNLLLTAGHCENANQTLTESRIRSGPTDTVGERLGNEKTVSISYTNGAQISADAMTVAFNPSPAATLTDCVYIGTAPCVPITKHGDPIQGSRVCSTGGFSNHPSGYTYSCWIVDIAAWTKTETVSGAVITNLGAARAYGDSTQHPDAQAMCTGPGDSGAPVWAWGVETVASGVLFSGNGECSANTAASSSAMYFSRWSAIKQALNLTTPTDNIPYLRVGDVPATAAGTSSIRHFQVANGWLSSSTFNADANNPEGQWTSFKLLSYGIPQFGYVWQDSNPAAARDCNNKITVAGQAASQIGQATTGIFFTTETSTNVWPTTATSLGLPPGVSVTKSIAAAYDDVCQLWVFVTDSTGNVWYRRQSGPGSSTFTAWATLSFGTNTKIYGGIAAARWPGTGVLTVVGVDGSALFAGKAYQLTQTAKSTTAAPDGAWPTTGTLLGNQNLSWFGSSLTPKGTTANDGLQYIATKTDQNMFTWTSSTNPGATWTGVSQPWTSNGGVSNAIGPADPLTTGGGGAGVKMYWFGGNATIPGVQLQPQTQAYYFRSDLGFGCPVGIPLPRSGSNSCPLVG